jgi:hypothetical protein
MVAMQIEVCILRDACRRKRGAHKAATKNAAALNRES